MNAFAGTGAVRAAHRFDQGRLVEWMARHVPGFAGPLTVTQFKGGQSNPTYRLDTPARSYVLRRKPPGMLLKGAHAVEREARVQSALAAVGFPVACIHALCEDADVVGTPFYVMDMVEGRVFWNAALPGLRAAERAACYDAMNRTIAELHRVDPVAVGLGGYGRPQNYLARQLDRWTRQYRDDPQAGRFDAMDRLADWLATSLPAGGGAAIVHGDFRIDNLIFAEGSPEVAAVLDWELSTLGDPLVDFAYHVMMYRMPALTIPGLRGNDLAALGVPDEAAYVAAYCRRTGRDGIADLDYYIAFNFFRFAAICHGVKGRMLRGNAASAEAERLAADLPRIAEIGWEMAAAGGGGA